jgi:hypothetical protein
LFATCHGDYFSSVVLRLSSPIFAKTPYLEREITMASTPTLRLDLVDVYGNPLNENVDLIFRHLELDEVVRKMVKPKGTIDIVGLRGMPLGRYQAEIDPHSYQYSSFFLNMKASGITALKQKFAIDPKKVVSVDFPAYNKLNQIVKELLSRSSQVLGFSGLSGKGLYDALTSDRIRCAGFLNIVTKCGATGLTGGSMVLPEITELLEVRGDRFFARVPKELRENVKNSVNGQGVKKADESLHHPPSGYTHAGSFKTRDHYGNLQLTFFMNSEDCVCDIDIDDAAGIEHIFQVLHNAISGEPTHPYNIHEILVGGQGLDPGYTFKLA